MIHVTHNGHDRRTWEQFHIGVLFMFIQERIRIIQFRRKGFVTQLFYHNHRGVLVEYLVDRDHLPHFHQTFDDFGSFDRHFVRQIGHGNGFRHVNLVNHRLGRSGKSALIRIGLMAVFVFGLAARTPAAIIAHCATGFQAATTATTIILILARNPFFRFFVCCGRGACFGGCRFCCGFGFAFRFDRFVQSAFRFGHEFFRWFFFPTIEFFGFGLRLTATAFTLGIFLVLQFTISARFFERSLRLCGVLTRLLQGFIQTFLRFALSTVRFFGINRSCRRLNGWFCRCNWGRRCINGRSLNGRYLSRRGLSGCFHNRRFR